MKKGKAIEDNQLDNIQGGYVLERKYKPVFGPATITSYSVINKNGRLTSIDYADKGWAQHIAREDGESDQVITEEEYKKIFGHNPPESFNMW